MIEWRDVLGRPVVVGDRSVTPVARSFAAYWPGGGCVSSRPAAVIVERGGRVERIPVPDLERRIIGVIGVCAAALIALSLARTRRRRRSND